MRYKNLIFDFDGVIADSVNVKTEAFRKMYLPFGNEIAGKVVEHHLNNGGMSRFKKFRLYHKEFLNIDLSDEEIKKLSDEFSSIVIQSVIEAPYVKNADKFLIQNKDNFRMWIVSGTPTDEIRIIVSAKNIDLFFQGVYGSPETKDYWTKKIIEDNRLINDETIFIGDAIADYEAAKFCNISFALRESSDNKKLFDGINGIFRFIDFDDLQKFLVDKQ
ncbi:MAG: HAD family hydrolase [Ignavibacteriaceae bacterium]|nr:HAD family hydrolase [Ignavibacteriaceae bacterium]